MCCYMFSDSMQQYAPCSLCFRVGHQQIGSTVLLSQLLTYPLLSSFSLISFKQLRYITFHHRNVGIFVLPIARTEFLTQLWYLPNDLVGMMRTPTSSEVSWGWWRQHRTTLSLANLAAASMVIDTIDTLRFLQDIFVPVAERKNPTNNKSTNLQLLTANLRGSLWIYSKAGSETPTKDFGQWCRLLLGCR